MPIRYERHITRAMLRAEPDTLFVFGDNLQRKGLGGQAKEMRGEPNAVGIPTKRAPGMREADFFRDDDIYDYQTGVSPALHQLHQHANKGGTIVLPTHGIGTGLADLERRAPKIWGALRRDLARLIRCDRSLSRRALNPGETEDANA